MEKEKKQKNRFPKITRKRVIIFIVLLVIIAGGIFHFRNKTSDVVSEGVMTESKVSKGDIEVKISGSGTIEPYERYEITSLVQGEILTCPFEEGDIVKKDEVLYTIDSSSAQSNIKKVQNNIDKAVISNKDNQDNINNLIIKASQDGYITDLNLEVGDNVNNNSKIATITNTSNLKLKVTFPQTQISNLYVGQSVNVILADYMSTISGTIIYINPTSRTLDNGTIVNDIEVGATNPGAVVNGAKATVSVLTSNGIQKSSEGSIEIKSVSVISKSSGEITNLYVKNNEKVYTGQVIATLYNESYYNTQKQNALNLDDLYESLGDANDNVDDYNIKSPIDGVIITKNKKVGDKIGNSSSNSDNSTSSLMVVADISKMKFAMSVDELDVSDIKIDQEVQITAEALEGESFIGKINKIPAEGTTTNGVTTYSVEVVIDEPGNLKTGMNVNAEVVIQDVKGVLKIPMSAVTKVRGKSYTYVKDDIIITETEKIEVVNEKIPAGYKLQEITTGMNNDDYIEVVSGLNEGDIVYSLITSKSGNTQNTMNRMMGMPNAAGGGMSRGDMENSGRMRNGSQGGEMPNR